MVQIYKAFGSINFGSQPFIYTDLLVTVVSTKSVALLPLPAASMRSWMATTPSLIYTQTLASRWCLVLQRKVSTFPTQPLDDDQPEGTSFWLRDQVTNDIGSDID